MRAAAALTTGSSAGETVVCLSLEQTGGCQCERTVAQVRDRLLLLKKVLDDPDTDQIVGEMIERPSTGDHKGHIVPGVGVGKRRVVIPTGPRLLDEPVVARRGAIQRLFGYSVFISMTKRYRTSPLMVRS
jgi:hypothetical protein